jgi:hypothetical protein
MMVAQEHATIGVFGDYTRLAPINTNMWGLGARVGFDTHHLTLEGEMSYDFDATYTSNLTGVIDNFPPTPARNSLHLWSGLFGPKFQIGGPVKLFVEAKGGFLNFAGGNPSFVSQVNSFGSASTYGVFFPGAGIQGHLGPVGLRLDVGDEMYFNNGAHHNLKVMAGPFFRF